MVRPLGLGLVTGVGALILAMGLSLGLTLASGVHIVIPGIFESWPGNAPDGSPQLRFLPHPAGMGVALLLWTGTIALLSVRFAKSRRQAVRDAKA